MTVLLPVGLDQLLIRERKKQGLYLRALRAGVWLSWLVIGGFVVVASPLLAWWLDLGPWHWLLWLLPFVLLFQAFKWGIKPLLSAELGFEKITKAEFLHGMSLWFGGGILLLIWPSAGALYVAYGLAELLETLWLWRGRGIGSMWKSWRSMRTFRSGLRHHRRFCTVMCVDQGFNNASHQAPALLLGGLLGGSAVGIFGVANRLITVPIYLLIGALGRVTLPIFAGLSEEELKRRVLTTLQVSAAFIPPVLIWTAFFAAEIATVILGESWAFGAAPLLPWLLLNLLFQCLFSPISVIDVIRDKPEITLGWNVVNLAVRSVALGVGAFLEGLYGAIALFSLASALMWLVYGGLLAWMLGAGQKTFALAWSRLVPLWLLLALSLGLIKWFDWHWIADILASLIPIGLYAIGLLIFAPPAIEVALKLVSLDRLKAFESK